MWDLDVAFKLCSSVDNSKLCRSDVSQIYVAVTDYDDVSCFLL